MVACGVAETSTSRYRRQLRQELRQALNSVYMGHCMFLPRFDVTPLQAISAFSKKPEVFGRLRTYIGKSTQEINKRRVLRLAKSLLALDAAAATPSRNQPDSK